jgi:hypothetical protein
MPRPFPAGPDELPVAILLREERLIPPGGDAHRRRRPRPPGRRAILGLDPTDLPHALGHVIIRDSA